MCSYHSVQYILFRITGFLDFIHIPYFNRILDIYTYLLLPPSDKKLLLYAHVEAVKWHGGPVFENCSFFQNQLSRCLPDIHLRMGIDPFFNCSFFEY